MARGDPEKPSETNGGRVLVREPGPDGRTRHLLREDSTLKTNKTTLRAVWTTVGLLGLATACGGEESAGASRVTGRVTNGQGTQPQSFRAERVTTLSPCRADTGTLTASERPSSRALSLIHI